MFSSICKGSLFALLGVLSFGSLAAEECCEPCNCDRMYLGAFGGGIYSNSNCASQMGTIYFFEILGGPQSINAKGHTKSTSSAFGGAHIGYEWSRPNDCSCWSIAPAAELEAFYYSHNKKGQLVNPADRLRELDFLDSFDMKSTVVLANAVFTLNSPRLCGFSPYIGAGIGAAHISIHNAKSYQLIPPEEGINHFNSRRSDSTWAFAAQVKAGLRYTFCNCFHVFGEYRYLYVDTSKYVFGATSYPTHAPSSPWNVKINDIQYNAFAIGIDFDL